MALVMTVFLLSLVGIPGTAGFIAKLYVFKAAVEGRLWVLAAIGLLNSVIAAYYYLTPVVAMWMQPEAEGPGPARAGVSVSAALAICGLATLAFGLYPAPLLEIARELYNYL
jgi:NADH-quinone oxidoreductase subunit N